LKVRFCAPDDDDFLTDGDEVFGHGTADSSTAGDEVAVEGEGIWCHVCVGACVRVRIESESSNGWICGLAEGILVGKEKGRKVLKKLESYIDVR